MIGCCSAAACLDACRFGEESQQPTLPHVRQTRRWTHAPPIFRHSSQPAKSSGGSTLIWSRWVQVAMNPVWQAWQARPIPRLEPMARTAAQLLVECLEAEGVQHVFGIPGEETLDL